MHRDAILKAADFIEANPDRYRFMEIMIPVNETEKGCALGWIGYFAGMRRPNGGITDNMFDRVADALGYAPVNAFGVAHHAFYNDMKEAVGTDQWMHDAELAAQGLRILAEAA